MRETGVQGYPEFLHLNGKHLVISARNIKFVL